jgi:hypothetical protein
MNNILLGPLKGEFFLCNFNLNIQFNKYSQEIFHMVKNFNLEEIWVLTGPGSFIGTRSVVAFTLGYTYGTSIVLKGFNILLDLIPLMSKSNSKKEKLYVFNELNRFFYCIYEKDLIKREFFLLTLEELYTYKEKFYIVGNHEIGHEVIIIEANILYNFIFKNKERIHSFEKITLEYAGKFLI